MSIGETLTKSYNSFKGRVKSVLSSDAQGDLFKSSKRSIQTVESRGRKDPEKLEKLYYLEPLLFAGINFYVSQVVGGGFDLEGKEDKSFNVINEFVEYSDLDFKLQKVVQDICIFGNAYLELIWTKDHSRIVDIATVDAKSMQFIKDRDGRIMLDQQAKPIGYIQEIKGLGRNNEYTEELEELVEGKGGDPSEVSTGLRGIPFAREDIAHFKFNSLSDDMLGVGLIEPLYGLVILKIEVEESLGNGLKKSGFPLYIANIGEEGVHEPTQQEIRDFNENVLSEVEDMDAITVPYFYDIDVKSPGNIEKLNNYLDYFSEQICSGLGIPQSVLLKGTRISTGVTDISADQLQKNIEVRQKNLNHYVKDEIFSKVLDSYEIDYDQIPEIEFETLSPKVLTQKSSRLSEMARAGILTPDIGVENEIRKTEDLPEIDAEYRNKKQEEMAELLKNNKD